VTRSFMVQWIDFLGGGGRIVICLLAATAAVSVFRIIEARFFPEGVSSGPYFPASGIR